MPFKLTKKQIAERNELAAALRNKAASLAIALADYNATMAQVTSALHDATDAYNEAIGDARDFVAGIAEPAREEYDEKSERWQASDKGVEAERWLREWEAISLDDAGIEV